MQKGGTLVFNTGAKHQHAGGDSVSSKSPERLDAEKLKEGINALPRELLGLLSFSTLERIIVFLAQC